MSSLVLPAGNAAVTTNAIGSMHTPPTGANCRTGSSVTFGFTLGSASVPLSASISTCRLAARRRAPGSDAARRAGAVLDYELLAERLAELRREDARDRVHATARRVTDQHAYRAGRIVLSKAERRKDEECKDDPSHALAPR